MGDAQKHPKPTYVSGLSEQGLSRFEVVGRETDRELILSVARRLAEDGPEAIRLRAAVAEEITSPPAEKGQIWAALRASPMVGADLDLTRGRDSPRHPLEAER